MTLGSRDPFRLDETDENDLPDIHARERSKPTISEHLTPVRQTGLVENRRPAGLRLVHRSRSEADRHGVKRRRSAPFGCQVRHEDVYRCFGGRGQVERALQQYGEHPAERGRRGVTEAGAMPAKVSLNMRPTVMAELAKLVELVKK